MAASTTRSAFFIGSVVLLERFGMVKHRVAQTVGQNPKLAHYPLSLLYFFPCLPCLEKTALISGSGIGRSASPLLSREGARVLVMDAEFTVDGGYSA